MYLIISVLLDFTCLVIDIYDLSTNFENAHSVPAGRYRKLDSGLGEMAILVNKGDSENFSL